MSRNGQDHSSSKFPESIERRLNLYSLAAMAAGVSVLALAHPASAEVVVTKKKIPISGFGPTPIDLNNDGIADFQFQNVLGAYDHSFYGYVTVAPLTGGEAVGGNRGLVGPYASALVRGANVGPSAHFSTSQAREQLMIERTAGSSSAPPPVRFYYGKWDGVGNDRFVGVKFLIKGATHYGWIRLTINLTGRVSGTITEYGYETVANKKLGAGLTTDSSQTAKGSEDRKELSKPGPSIGMLALGADGLALWRRQ